MLSQSDTALELPSKSLIASHSDRYLRCYLGASWSIAMNAKSLKKWWTH